jgi:hypothetical protein
VQYNKDYKSLAECFAFAIKGMAALLHTKGMQNLLDAQVSFYEKVL